MSLCPWIPVAAQSDSARNELIGVWAQDREPAPSGGRLELLPIAGDDPASAGSLNAVAVSTDIDVIVRGSLADVTLVQAFVNTSAHWRNARYAFPMPEHAVVRGMTVRVGDRTINGVIKEKQQARSEYSKAAREGRVASLVSSARPNLFNTHISSIAPASRIEVTLDVLLPVSIEDDQFQLTLPTTMTPRYVNSESPDVPEVLSTIVQADVLASPPSVAVRVRVPGIKQLEDIASTSHSITLSTDQAHISGIADRDVTLAWPTTSLPTLDNETPGSARSGIWSTQHVDSTYTQLLLTPPAAAEGPVSPAPPRELVLVLDRSGSMAGAPLTAAHAAINAALDALRPEDRFNILGFDDQLYPLFSRTRKADTQSLNAARRFVKTLEANGGTEIAPALRTAINSSDNTPGTQLVFVTDGSIGYEDSLLATIEKSIGERRLFTVGIGSASNRWFLTKAAEIGRGAAVFASDTSEVENAIITLLEQLSAPILSDLALRLFDADGNELKGDAYPSPLPDLFMGRPVMVVARSDSAVARATLTANDNGTIKAYAWQVTKPDTAVTESAANGVAVWWTARRIDHLLDKQRVAANDEQHKAQITRLAISAGLVTRYTSFVAVEDSPSRPATALAKHTEVPNVIPAGATLQGIAMPVGAAGMDTLAVISAWSAFAALLLLRVTRRHRRTHS